MRKYKDFKEYMEDNYYDAILTRLKGYVAGIKDSFESREVYEVYFAKPEDFHVSGVTFKDMGNDQLEIRTTVDVEVVVNGRGRYGRENYDDFRQYNVFFKGVLKDGLHNVSITSITEYNPNEYDRNRSLSQSLVPYMYEEDVEKHAEDFLTRNYQKALLQPMPLPVEEIVAKMGMEMYYAPLEDGVFGKTYFGVAEVEVYESILGRERHKITTKPGTMLINPNVYFMYNIGTANNTIIHECVHWDRHRRPFELQKILEGNCDHISCEIVETYEGIREDDSAFKWMEWQANQLAPRILMPAEMTKKIYNNALRDCHLQNPHRRFAENMEEAIRQLATFFNVSLFAAKLRLIDVGYEEAHGAFVYCNDRYLPPFAFAKGSLGKNQTFVIDEKNAMFVLFMDPTLRELYCDGKVVYTNSMICLNTPKYIELNENGLPVLTEYALEHVNECCFVFDRQMSASKKYSDTFYRRCFLCKDVNSDNFIEANYNPNHKDNQSKSERREELSKVGEMSGELSKIMEELPQSFGRTLKYHMERRDINEEELSYQCHLSTQTISKYINQSNAEKKYENVVALCKGLFIHPVFMEDLIAKAGFDRKSDTVAFTVKFLIWNHPDDSVEEWQKKLDDAHVPLKLPKKKS